MGEKDHWLITAERVSSPAMGAMATQAFRHCMSCRRVLSACGGIGSFACDRCWSKFKSGELYEDWRRVEASKD